MTGKCPHGHFCSTFQQIQWLSSASSKQTGVITQFWWSRCEVFVSYTLLKVYFEGRGPVAVAQVAQSFLSGQDVPQDFLRCTSFTEQTCSLVPDQRAADHHIPASLLKACLCLQTDTKVKVEYPANVQDKKINKLHSSSISLCSTGQPFPCDTGQLGGYTF